MRNFVDISKDRVEVYYFGDPSHIGYKILFIKRASRLGEYQKYLSNVYEFGNVWQGISGNFNGEYITIIATGIGPSLIGDAVYALDRPGTICLFSGTCGGLSEKIEIGDYVIADRAICGDGYSQNFGYSYLDAVSGNFEVSKSTQKLIESKNLPVHIGKTFTTSSVVREAEIDFWGKVQSDVIAIEMAASAFFVAAIASNKNACAYFWVTDLPKRGKSFFDIVAQNDREIKDQRYQQTVFLDLELLISIPG